MTLQAESSRNLAFPAEISIPTNVSVHRLVYDESLVEEWTSLLSAEENVRLAEMKHENRRRSFLMGRASLRLMLSALRGVPALDIIIRVEENGSIVSPDTPWHISLAHSGEEAVSVASLQRVGVDLEVVSKRDDDLLGYITHESEFELIDPLPLERQEKLLLCWTAKEAVLKALGTGLRRSPKSVRVIRVDQNPLRMCIKDVEGHAWDIALERRGAYYLAIATPEE
ncbi:MAG: 4'-phosphopantetheinyl transferase superfamily protein [Bacteroidetes bacterium]|nr:MAG: 4'-phosphopantetheinyl transferase superfamily protein [Bacteroidota bacterium]